MQRTRKGLAAMVLLPALWLIQPVQADSLNIKPRVTDVKPGDKLYVNGLNEAQVRQRLGEPDKVIPAVGNPPISQWIYPNFTVYFERHLALHAVKHEAQQP